LKNQTFGDIEIIVVDNGSTDGTADLLKANYPHVVVLALRENKGFSYAVNRGIEAAKGNYVALLNNDTQADSNWLLELVSALDKNANAGLAASRILFMKDRARVNSLGIEYHLDGTTADIAYGRPNGNIYDSPKEIFGACSAAALYRRSLFDDIGLFDEEFFAYAEDVDISFRAQLMGYRCIYVPTAIVYHHGSATGVRHSPFNEYQVRRNEIWVMAKNMPDGILERYRWTMVLGQLLVILKAPALLFRRGSFSLFWARVKGKADGLSKWRYFREKGKALREGMRVSSEYIESLFSK
jgi:GT2 family glycosyltransferase